MKKEKSAPAPKLSPWWVYIVKSRSGKLYTGITTDVDRRFHEHQHDRRLGAKFFRSDPATAVVFREAANCRSSASRREAAIKKLSRSEKLQLLSGNTSGSAVASDVPST